MTSNTNWIWLHRLSSPRWFYQSSGRWLPWLCVITASLLCLGLIWGLAVAPQDAKQGNSYRIIYLHVPAAFLALAGYYLMAVSGGIALVWKIKLAFMVMKSAAPMGAIFTFIALFTGAIWGKPTWGTYWVWDARITSMLILLFLYFGVLALRYSFSNTETAEKASAILSLIGMVNIPIIYKSVDWWHTLHQPATLKLTEKSTMHPDMLQPLIVMVIGFYCFYAMALLLSTRTEILRRERRAAWVRTLVINKMKGDQ